MPPACKILNLAKGMLTVGETRKILLAELGEARRSVVLAAKITPGCESTRKGDALQGALRSSLQRRREEGLPQWVVLEREGAYLKPIRAIGSSAARSCTMTAI